jgi:DtxR family Mn-dependent transcriptional regulator
MSRRITSRRAYEYLASLAEALDTEYVSLKKISERLKVKPSSAYEYLEKLVSLKYVEKIGRGKYKITAKGLEELGLRMWAHGVLETYFHKILNIEPDKACLIASRIDHMFPIEVIERLCIILGHPSTCPHNHKIPHKGVFDKNDKTLMSCFLNNVDKRRSVGRK